MNVYRYYCIDVIIQCLFRSPFTPEPISFIYLIYTFLNVLLLRPKESIGRRFTKQIICHAAALPTSSFFPESLSTHSTIFAGGIVDASYRSCPSLIEIIYLKCPFRTYSPGFLTLWIPHFFRLPFDCLVVSVDVFFLFWSLSTSFSTTVFFPGGFLYVKDFYAYFSVWRVSRSACV